MDFPLRKDFLTNVILCLVCVWQAGLPGTSRLGLPKSSSSSWGHGVIVFPSFNSVYFLQEIECVMASGSF